MPRGQTYPPAVKAEAIRQYVNGAAPASIARKLRLSPKTILGWVNKYDPARQPASMARYQNGAAELGDLVYDTCVDTLQSIRARAVETSRPEWVRAQTAADVAALDAAQWDRVIRVISAFRPREEGEPGD
jgi:transposase-like protein